MAEGSQAAANVKPDQRRADCGRCGGPRNCDVCGHYRDSGSDAEGFIHWTTDWYILKCRGCDFVFAQTLATNSEDYDNYYDVSGNEVTEYNQTIEYWPAPSKRERPRWLSEYGIIGVPYTELDQPIIELYSALNSGLVILSGIGVRTVFDVAAEVLGVDPAETFSKKLDALVNSGHIGKVDRDRIDTILEAGNASAHRGWRPTPSDLNTMMDVLETFIADAFVGPETKRRLDKKAAAMKATVPPRPPRQKKTRPATQNPSPSSP